MNTNQADLERALLAHIHQTTGLPGAFLKGQSQVDTGFMRLVDHGNFADELTALADLGRTPGTKKGTQ